MNIIPEIQPRTISIDTDSTGDLYSLRWTSYTGISGYNVYCSLSPSEDFQLVTISGTQVNEFSMGVPRDTPREAYIYFKVSYVTIDGSEVFIDSSNTNPISLEDYPFISNPHSETTENMYIMEADMNYYIEEIRRRTKAVIEDSAEDWEYYMRMWNGIPCPTCLDAEYDEFYPDVPRQPNARCSDCFGTGILGGYYKKIDIRGIYSTMPNRNIQFKDLGIQLQNNFEFHTFWKPRMRRQDILIRKSTGDRFIIQDIAEDRTWRNITIMQSASLQFLGQDNFLYRINNQSIDQAISKQSKYTVQQKLYFYGWRINV